jgi:hypothetical protein
MVAGADAQHHLEFDPMYTSSYTNPVQTRARHPSAAMVIEQPNGCLESEIVLLISEVTLAPILLIESKQSEAEMIRAAAPHVPV